LVLNVDSDIIQYISKRIEAQGAYGNNGIEKYRSRAQEESVRKYIFFISPPF